LEDPTRKERLLLTPAEAAELLGLKLAAIRRLCRTNAIPHVKVARKLRFNPDALKAWTTGGCKPPAAEQRRKKAARP
jgi:excisionase family DNA binding protein